MNLILTVLLIAIVIIVALVVLSSAFSHIPRQISSSQAESNITNYIATAYPYSVVNITSITEAQPGNWTVQASVVTNSTSPCPSYFILSFDYPQYGIVPRTQNSYTGNCKVYGRQPGSVFLISSSPVAITDSYQLNIPQVMQFISQYGFNNVSVSAKYLKTAYLNYQNYSDVWIINYTTPRSNSTVGVAINQVNGTLAYSANPVT